MKKILSILAVFVISLLTISMVGASNLSDVQVKELKINGNTVEDGENVFVEEGEDVEIDVKVFNDGLNTAEDIEIEAAIKGYEYSDYESLTDSTHIFNLDSKDSRWEDLSVSLPHKLDKDLYLLRVRVTDKNSNEVTKTYNLKVNPARHGLDIDDVVFSPGTTVVAGRSLLATVLIDNFGGKDEQDVKVTLDIPELGVSASEYVSEIDSDDRKTSEELFLKVPQCVEEGEYTAKVTLKYDRYETVTKEFTLTVLANDKCGTAAGKLVIELGSDTQNVVAGQEAVFPLALTNDGSTAKNYVLELTAGNWATSQMSENLVVLEPKQTKVVYAYLTANEGVSGEQMASLAVKDDGSVLKTITLTANVVPQEKNLGLRNYLEIALIVLVVILVILGLILGFSRLKRDEDEFEEGEDKTYY